VDYWRRIHRGAVALGRCPRCGEEPEEGATECPMGHPRTQVVKVRKPPGLRPLEVSEAYETARVLEARMGEVVDSMLTRLGVCGNCRHPRERHKNDGPCGSCVGLKEMCQVFEWSVTLGEVVTVFNAMKSAVRHEQRIDRDLGLDKAQPQEHIVWLPGVSVAEFKRLTPEEQDRKMLEAMGNGEAMGGGAVVDVEKVEDVE